MSYQYPYRQQPQQSSQHWYSQSQSQSQSNQPASQAIPPHKMRNPSPAIFVGQTHGDSTRPYASTSSQTAYSPEPALMPPSSSSTHYFSNALHQASTSTSASSVTRPPSAMTRYAAPAQAGSPPPITFSQASAITSVMPSSSQAEPSVSSRMLSSLQSLVTLIGQQNTKLDKQNAILDQNAQTIKSLSECFTRLEAETVNSREGSDSVGKTMSKKLKAFTEAATKTLRDDIARSLEKDLDKLRKETSDLSKIATKFSKDETASKLVEVMTMQGQILQALTSNQEANTEQADSIVDRISDHQLDLLHRLSEQFRLVTASITTSALGTRQAIEQSASRQDQVQQEQLQQFLSVLKGLATVPNIAQQALQPSREAEHRFIMPTPPTSQLSRVLQPASSAARTFLELPPVTAPSASHRCAAVECTSCLFQETPASNQDESRVMVVTTMTKNSREAEDTSPTANQDEGFHSQIFGPASQSTETQVSTMPILHIQDCPNRDLTVTKPLLPSSPNRQARSPTRSSTARGKRSSRPSRSFVMKKRVIPQSDDEEAGDETNAEPQDTEQVNLNEEPPKTVSEPSPMDRFALAFQKVEAWRSGNAAVSQMSTATSSEQALASSQTQDSSTQQDSEVNSPAVTTLPPSADLPAAKNAQQSKKRSAKGATKAQKPKTSLLHKRRKI